MINTKEKIKLLSDLEKNMLIMEKLISNKFNARKSLEKTVLEPCQPKAPSGVMRSYPHYDEKKYRIIAKEKGASLSNFRECCVGIGGWMFSTLFLAPLCVIPFLLAILSFPFSVGHLRRKGRKIYLEECQQIEKENKKLERDLEQYNIDMVKYRDNLKEYNDYLAVLPQKEEMLRQKFKTLEITASHAREIANKMYDALNISSEYRDFIFAITVDNYFTCSIANNINDALSKYKDEERAGKIPQNLETCSEYRSLINHNAPYLINAIDFCNSETTAMLNNLINSINNIENSSKSMVDMLIEKTEGICNKITAETEIMA